MSTTRRKMLAADETLANRVVDIAKRREQTAYQTVNSILEQAIKADSMGLALEDIIDNREMIERAKSMGLTFTVERLLYQMVDIAHNSSKKKIEELWLETGRWYGKYFSTKKQDPIIAFKEAMGLLNLGDPVFTIENGKTKKLQISCVGERFSEGFTEVLSLYIEGVMESLGYKRNGKNNSKGIIRLTFKM